MTRKLVIPTKSKVLYFASQYVLEVRKGVGNMMRVGVFVGKRCDVMAILPYTYIYSVNANNNNGQSKEQIEGGTNCIYSK